MKLRHLIGLAAIGGAAYQLYKHREELEKQTASTIQWLQAFQQSQQKARESLAVIQSYQKPIAEMVTDLQQQVRVFQQSAQGHLQVIQEVTKKHF